MSKAKVAFRLNRIAEDDWQIIAEYPGAETRYIKASRARQTPTTG
jgi:hypothetical protein